MEGSTRLSWFYVNLDFDMDFNSMSKLFLTATFSPKMLDKFTGWATIGQIEEHEFLSVLEENEWESRIKNKDMAKAISGLMEVPVRSNNKKVQMEIGDRMLIAIPKGGAASQSGSIKFKFYMVTARYG